ncbi:glycoside hydrolase family 97 catalytic domain-containing protein [Virgibacillus ihumii]|uniref:glycoside hydrolase family 97 catalytic domain-containing protein n=1 Tax=Virgibacillus ihumii TaxID=2686091 RepID=UPI001C2DD3B1|nr:glycoside hydrolase family 97 catalytic domain-containing protein [Virgibacillus ihumii]
MFNKKGYTLILFLGLSLMVSLSVSTAFASSSESPNKNDHEKKASISSPNGKVHLDFELSENGKPHYELSYKGEELIEPSSLGFEFKNQKALKGSFKIVKTSMKTFNNTWEPVWGEKSKIRNHYKQLTIYLQEKEAPNRKMNLVFKLYNNGVGFRYVLPEQENLDKNIRITAENTEFKFSSDNTSWWIPNDWNSYEYNYKNTPLSEVEEVSTPFTMKTPEGTFLTVHEAALIDYAGMALKKVDGESTTLKSYLAPWPNSNVKVKKDALPVKTPWRTIQIGDDAGDLVESDMILNLNEPSALEDTSWIEPMKYIGIWWEMISGDSTWESGPKHGATTENAKKYIDFAYKYLDSENQNIGLLVEGWNIGWDGNWMENGDEFSFTQPYPDYNLKEVVEYAQDHGVSYIMHNETSGNIINYEKQMDEAYDLYQELGIHAIKSGYVADNGMHNPEDQSHHGQYMVNHYLEAVKKAAKHQIMIDTHEPIKGTGLRRTYPNWMSREGVSGMEYAAFGDDNNLPKHSTILPFTRMMAGPIDFTPGIFDVKTSNNPNTRVLTTRAKQLALYVTISSGVQMVADEPKNYKDEDGNILPAFEFIKDVPVTWDDIIVPKAKIGDYVSIIRQKGEEWYIGSITDKQARDLEIDLDFLDKGKKYVAEIYSDGPNADWKTNPNPVSIKKAIVKSNDTFVASLAAGGGQAVRIYPASKKEIAKLPNYKAKKMKLSYTHVPESIQSNDSFEIKVNIRNKGNVIVGKNLKLQIDGKTVAKKHVRVAPGGTEEIRFTYNKLFKTGDHRISVNGLPAKKITVEKKKTIFEYSNFSVSAQDQTITATAEVTNFGSYKDVAEVPLFINEELVKRKRIEVPAQAGGGSKDVTFTYSTSDNIGVYKVAIGNLESKLAALPKIELAGGWLFHKGDNLDWKAPGYDDSGWQKVNLPASWEEHSNYTENNVYGWYRKEIFIPEEWKGHSLKVTLGKIDDMDATYFNGQKIGQSGKFPTGDGWDGAKTAWNQMREYTIPADTIKYGQNNVISIRVFDGTGGGGIYSGPIKSIKLVSETTATNLKMLVQRYKETGEFANDRVARSLRIHLVTVSRYEENGSAEKVVKHMKGFKRLLDHQKGNDLISEKAYKVLKADADYLIKKWQ